MCGEVVLCGLYSAECLHVNLSVYVFLYIPVLSVMSVYLSLCLSISVSDSVCLFLCLSVRLIVQLSMCVTIYLFVSVSVRFTHVAHRFVIS